MRIGIMGGTLDPVHSGHICIAQAVLQALKLDGVMLLPAGDPPHKQHPTLKTDRLNMARLAAQELPGMFVSDMEIMRGGTTYTVDTLRELRSSRPGTDWVYIIGADTLDVLDTWRNFAEVAKLCEFAVVGRAEEDANPERMRELEAQYGARFIPLGFNGPEISSTEIRRRAAAGESLEGLVPDSVADYIRRNGLYLSSKSKDEILRTLQATLKPGRYAHTLGVAETAVRLAERFGVSPAKAELSALLHDCAKYMPLEEMRSLIREGCPDADAQEMETESVIHAPAGMVLARKEFGVCDPEILSAIRKHTLGDAKMSALDALIYTADFIEPNRKSFPGLEEARALAERDIFAAALRCAELTNQYVERQGRKAHPRTIAMLHAGIRIKEEKHD